MNFNKNISIIGSEIKCIFKTMVTACYELQITDWLVSCKYAYKYRMYVHRILGKEYTFWLSQMSYNCSGMLDFTF